MAGHSKWANIQHRKGARAESMPTDDKTGFAVRVEPIRVGGRLKEIVPD